MERKNARKFREGVVHSNKMDKTVTVRVERRMPHPHHGKVIKLNKKYYAHTDKPIEVGKRVKIQETRPLSKLKRWRVVEELG